MKRCTLIALAVCSLLSLVALAMLYGCSTACKTTSSREVNSYFDPSRTGRYSVGPQGAPIRGSFDPNVFGSPGPVVEPGPPGSLPTLDEEVWVIARNTDPQQQLAKPNDDTPGSGALMGRIAEGSTTRDVPLPLKHTDVSGAIDAYIASVTVKQQFQNPYNGKIEALYVFPLPDNAAITGFVMTIGERHIRGIIREREEAKRIYNDAKSQGYVASLMTQERPNIFTQHVANIEPGRQIDVDITYFNTLTYDDGWYEFVFPMVVGPRFNPPAIGDKGIGAAAYGSSGASGQKVEVSYLNPNQRSGHDISLAMSITAGAGVPIEEIACKTHKINVSHETSEQVRVELDAADHIPNRDFVLRYRVAGERVKAGVLVQKDPQSNGGYFTFMLFPPRQMTDLNRSPMEMIFVLDCSGSMNGQPIAQAKSAINAALEQLQPQDTFQIVQFSNTASQLGPRPLFATPGNIRKGHQYVASLNSEGGTMMIEGIKAALDFSHDEGRLRVVTFLTDGFIGNEAEILGEIHNRLGETRIFSFGVGSSTNHYLLNNMAKMGNGSVAYLGLKDDGAKVMDAFLERVSHPAMTDIRIDADGGSIGNQFPSHTPDLFVGRPVIVTGRFQGQIPRAIRVTGKVNGETVKARFDINDHSSAQSDALAGVWARAQIADLSDRAAYVANAELPQQIKSIALQYGLMSAYTSFLAVDSATRTAGTQGTSVNVGVPVPEGVKYSTTVSER